MPRSRQAERFCNSINPPTYSSASYYFRDQEDVISGLHEKTITRGRYGRYNNPTWDLVEERVARLNDTDDCLLFASGMAAHVTAFMTFLEAGSRAVFPSECYRQTRNVFRRILPRFGVEAVELSIRDPQSFIHGLGQLEPKPTLVHLEMPSSPHMYCIDLDAVRSAVGGQAVISLDTSFAPPPNLMPFHHGIDLAICSATKYLNGHGDIVAGVVAGKQSLIDRIRWHRDTMGAVADGRVAELLMRSLHTLEMRIERVNSMGMRVAEFLENHPGVHSVYYTGLDSHPHAELAARYLRGHGGVVTFDLPLSRDETAKIVQKMQLPYMASNFGAPQTLVEQSTFFTYFEYGDNELAEIGVSHGTVRLALGYTDSVDEIIIDLDAALKR